MAPSPQDDLQSARRKIKSLTKELLTVYEELALLYSLDAQFGRLADEEQIAVMALKEAVEILRADCGWVALWYPDGFRVPERCRIQIGSETAEHINQAILEPLHSRGKSQFLVHDFPRESGLPAPDVPSRFLACSLPAKGGPQGYLCLGRRYRGPIFTSVDQKLANAVASMTGTRLENVRLQHSELEKQRLENELELARSIQRSLLPSDFNCVSFLDATGVSLPSYEICGDYFDLLRLGANLGLLVIADVCGKGPAAALQATMVQGIIHAVSHLSSELGYIIGTLNACLRARAVQGNFVTAFLGILDSSGRLRYTNGGHNPPLWIQANGPVTELTEGGPLLGVFEKAEFPESSIQMARGDLLFLYTDGVTDSEDEHGHTFGVERLLEWARGQTGRSPVEVEQSLLRKVTHFCGSRRQADDLTFLIVRFQSD